MSDKKEKNPKSPYSDEMDELVRVFKEELDKAVAEAEAEDTTEEYDVEGYNPKEVSRDKSKKKKAPSYSEDELCECCGERPRGTEKNPDSLYCEECEAILEKYPYDWKGLVAIVAMLGVVITAIICFAINMPIFANMQKGDRYAKENKLFSAMTYYDLAKTHSTDNTETPSTTKAIPALYAKRIAVEYKLLYMDMVITEYEAYIPEGIRNFPQFKEATAAYNDIHQMMGSVSIIERVSNGYASIDDIDYDKAMAEYDALIGKTVYEQNGNFFLEGDEGFVKDENTISFPISAQWINIYKYSMAVAKEKDEQELIKHLEAANKDSDYLQRFISPLLASTYIGVGEYAKAEPLIELVKTHNAEGVDYHMLTAMMYRCRDGEYQKGIDVCVEGLNMLSRLYDTNLVAYIGHVLSMQKTLCFIMLKDYESAYNSAVECYSYSSETGTAISQAKDLYAILALATNRDDVYETLKAEIENLKEVSPENVIDFSSDVSDYKAGKITLEEIVKSGRYDLI